MESTDFVKADSRNLLVVDPFMLAAYFNALHVPKQPRSTRGEDGFGPREVKNSSDLPTIFWGGGGAEHIHLQKIYGVWGPRFVLESPGSSHGALIRPAGHYSS